MNTLDINSDYASIRKVFAKLRSHIPTLTANQYNYYRDPDMPSSQTIIKRTEKQWNDILCDLSLPQPLSRDTMARLSNALHLLEKKIKETLGIGWPEKSFQIAGKILRPDAFFAERSFTGDPRSFLLDVKLCVSSAPLTIYKYLPLFENPTIPAKDQLTFFPHWLPQSAFNDEPMLHYDQEGQMSLALRNHILYICYLVGVPRSDRIPCSTICGRDSAKRKKLPKNMEVRYISFANLPEWYALMSGVEFDRDRIEPIMQCANLIRGIVQSLSENANEMSTEIYQRIKRGEFSEVGLPNILPLRE